MTQRYQFQFPPGQEPELVPEDKEKIEERFNRAWDNYVATEGDELVTARGLFLAGYIAGYGHANDDANQIAANWHTPTN
jgi:hypothetical protein